MKGLVQKHIIITPLNSHEEIENKNMTFDEVTNPYLEKFGFPDQAHEFELETENYIQWYWYKHDVVVEFVCPREDTENGWEISYAFSLDPLRYFNKNNENLDKS